MINTTECVLRHTNIINMWRSGKARSTTSLLCFCMCVSVGEGTVPLEWKEMRQSQRGHLSTGSLRITSSGKMTTVMYSNLQSLSKIWVIGLDFDFFIMQQIPTTICRSGGWTRKRRARRLSFWLYVHKLKSTANLFSKSASVKRLNYIFLISPTLWPSLSSRI